MKRDGNGEGMGMENGWEWRRGENGKGVGRRRDGKEKRDMNSQLEPTSWKSTRKEISWIETILQFSLYLGPLLHL